MGFRSPGGAEKLTPTKLALNASPMAKDPLLPIVARSISEALKKLHPVEEIVI